MKVFCVCNTTATSQKSEEKIWNQANKVESLRVKFFTAKEMKGR